MGSFFIFYNLIYEGFFFKKCVYKWCYLVDWKYRKMLLVFYRVLVIYIKIMFWFVLLYENKLILDYKFDMLKKNN